MQEARTILGQGRIYVTFDIDSDNPSFAPGTGTPEIGGFSTRETQKNDPQPHGIKSVWCRFGRGVAAI
jgi:hypothetical protein